MSRLRLILRDPLLHFLVIGALLFVAYAVFNPDEMPVSGDDKTIVVDGDDVNRMAVQFEKTWRRAPGPDEIEAMVAAYIRDEVLYREALTLSLDQGDVVIRRRLVQKMQFLLGSVAGAAEPGDDELRTYLAENADRYRQGAVIGFEQVFPGNEAINEDAARARAALAAGDGPETVGASTLLPPVQRPAAERAVDATFGNGFFAQIPQAVTGDWVGPVRSAYGLHLVRVTDARPARAPDLDALRPRLVRDWQAETSQKLTEARIDALKSGYSVQRTDRPAGAGTE